VSKELQEYCRQTVPHLQRLAEQLRIQKPAAVPPNISQLHQLMGVLTDMQNSLDTLIGIQKQYLGKDSFAKLLEAAGGMDATPDYGYYGPAPEFSANPSFGGAHMPTAGGMAALAGFAGDFTSAVTAFVKQHLALRKQLKEYQKDPGPLKNDLRVAYCALFELLGNIMVKCADSEPEAKKYHEKGGFNKMIARDAWRKVQAHSWCATVS
jgi:hypothetical protein